MVTEDDGLDIRAPSKPFGNRLGQRESRHDQGDGHLVAKGVHCPPGSAMLVG